ncbi:methyltransferase [Hungatella hathewayi]|uniref:methyltransferase n=1 Tax=Hungatella hathewayi TaxID=154046 RepID=UPI002672F8E9|nr:methyltransferase [Hungatella hathewayi]
MSKLTKREIQLHDQAVCLLQKEHLSHEDKLFIFENFREDAEHINSKSGAFFTPFGLANDFTLQIPCLYGKTIRIIDLCAGIGVLSYAAQLECSDRSRCYADITCVELNPHYVEVGKKVVPEATWICADVLDPFLPDLLGQFDFAIANPPFGRIANNYRKSYMSGEFEYMVIEAASRIAKEGAFIIPQMSAPFIYSGTIAERKTIAGFRKGVPEHLKKGLGFYWSLTKGSTRPTIKMTGIAPRQYAKSYVVTLQGQIPLPPKGAGGLSS